MALLEKDIRRNRCSLYGCRQRAVLRIGKKVDGFYLCEDHFNQLKKEIKTIKFDEPEVPEVVEEPQEIEVLADEPVDEHPNFEEGGEGFFVCKYCGKEFAKNEYTVSQFATHARLCKREHQV